jgi:hypothetical protein
VNNEGPGTQVWVSPNRYVVVDLSAGPVHFGMIETEGKAPTIASLPIDRNAKLWQPTSDPEMKVEYFYILMITTTHSLTFSIHNNSIQHCLYFSV